MVSLCFKNKLLFLLLYKSVNYNPAPRVHPLAYNFKECKTIKVTFPKAA